LILIYCLDSFYDLNKYLVSVLGLNTFIIGVSLKLNCFILGVIIFCSICDDMSSSIVCDGNEVSIVYDGNNVSFSPCNNGSSITYDEFVFKFSMIDCFIIESPLL